MIPIPDFEAGKNHFLLQKVNFPASDNYFNLQSINKYATEGEKLVGKKYEFSCKNHCNLVNAFLGFRFEVQLL